ncbi:MAG: rRNA methyltransferase [Hyphobacterium sp.]|nr:MAG: rRNA methyltransferase [Hyphobacterium sp.]
MTRPIRPLRGYFGIGAEEISKAMNLGAILRTAHAFGASFAFTVNAHHKARAVFESDTSRSLKNVPYFGWDNISEMRLPEKCALVGIELTDDAVDLPSFRHPRAAAYVLGRERGSLSEEMQARCDHIVRIPTKFCVNVSVAAAITLYDRTLCHGGHPERPVMPGGPGLDAVDEWIAKRRDNL